jgi:hypothetical protein
VRRRRGWDIAGKAGSALCPTTETNLGRLCPMGDEAMAALGYGQVMKISGW